MSEGTILAQYAYTQRLSRSQWAWELLRRNPDFQEDARRHKGDGVGSRAKSDKDFRQAGILIEALGDRRAFELGEALHVAEASGPKWKAALRRAETGLGDELAARVEKAREAWRRAQ